MTLKEFRDKFPGFRPHAIVAYQDGRLLEVISWPYEEEDGPVLVKARTPGDPTTIATYRVTELTTTGKTMNVLKDALANLDPEVGSGVDYARGVLVGVIAGIIHSKGCSFREAINEVKPHLPARTLPGSVPKGWPL